jgi:hypothetical protein
MSSRFGGNADVIDRGVPGSHDAAPASPPARELVLDALGGPGGFASGPNLTLSAVPDVPPDGGTAETVLQVTISALAAGTDASATRELVLDLTPYARSGAVLTVWSKTMSLTNLAAAYVLFTFREPGYAAYRIAPTEVAVWQRFAIPLARPSSADEVDWSAVTRLALRVDAAPDGRFTGRIRFHDLRLTTAPSGDGGSMPAAAAPSVIGRA